MAPPWVCAFLPAIGLLTASELFELSDFKNSLKSLASAGVAIEGPSQEFERPQSLLDGPGQPVFNRVVAIGQAHDGKLRTVQPELVEPFLRRHDDNPSLPRSRSAICRLFMPGDDPRAPAGGAAAEGKSRGPPRVDSHRSGFQCDGRRRERERARPCWAGWRTPRGSSKCTGLRASLPAIGLATFLPTVDRWRSRSPGTIPTTWNRVPPQSFEGARRRRSLQRQFRPSESVPQSRLQTPPP